MIEQFINDVSLLGITLNEKQIKQFRIYYETLVEWNKKMNLTAITDLEGVYYKHFYDSLCFIKSIKLDNQSILDVGSGAGFPSIPLKIIFPNLSITIIDALKKRITFLNHLSNQLGLEIEALHMRAEAFNQREHYDIVTARAVASLNMLSELCIPFVKVNGFFLPMKGQHAEAELSDSSNALETLGVVLDEVVTYTYLDQFRTIYRFEKTKVTPNKYPRPFAKIKKAPL